MRVHIRFNDHMITLIGTYQPAQRGDLETESLPESWSTEDILIREVSVIDLLTDAITEVAGPALGNEFLNRIDEMGLEAIHENGSQKETDDRKTSESLTDLFATPVPSMADFAKKSLGIF